MDNLFTPEVIQQFLTILDKAAEGSILAFVLWMCIPLVSTLIVASAWLYGIVYIVKQAKNLASTISENTYKVKELQYKERVQPKVYNLIDDITISHEVGEGLRLFLGSVTSSTYFHSSDLRKLKKAWNEYERTEITNKNN